MPSGGHLDPARSAQLGAVGWAVPHSPAVATQAIASKAAGGAAVRHIATGINIVVTGNTVAPAAQVLTFNLRDGASGAGTILISWTVGVEAVAGKSVAINLSGIQVGGSYNAAMTLEGSAAPGVNTFESVVLAGYDSA